VFLDAVKPTGNFGIEQMKFGLSFGNFLSTKLSAISYQLSAFSFQLSAISFQPSDVS
jgi:hypothetical protein